MIRKQWRSKKSLLTQVAIYLFFFFFSIHSQSFVAAKSFSSANSSEINQNLPVLKKGIYLVVGSFKIAGNASIFAERVRKMGYEAKAGLKQDNGLFYVYAFYSPDNRDAVLEKYHFVRRNSQLHDAWIMYVDIDRSIFEETEKDIAFEPLETTPAVTRPEVTQPVEEEAEEIVVAEETPEPVEEAAPEPGEGTFPYLFNVTNATTLKEVDGFIQIVDAERNQQYQTVNTNRIEQVQEPTTVSKKILAVCDIFGYIKQQIELKLDDPLTGADASVVTRDGSTTIVFFPLQRYSKGDVITMYNVYFYNDAAIMKPESRYELNSLLDMLKENENYVIKLHGHTNGNSPGKIIKLKEDDNNFFTVTENNVSGYGSAQDLSTERALTIKRWLEESGVEGKRISIKGWGGKKMIYNKNDPLAKRNIRVEVEILRE